MSLVFTLKFPEPALVFSLHSDVNGVLQETLPQTANIISAAPVIISSGGGFSAGDGITIVSGEIRLDIESLTQAI